MSAQSRFPTREEVLRHMPRGVAPGHPRFEHEFSRVYRWLCARAGRAHVIWGEMASARAPLRKDDGRGD